MPSQYVQFPSILSKNATKQSTSAWFSNLEKITKLVAERGWGWILSDLHVNCILLFSIHVGIIVVPLQSPKELLGLGCCFPLASSLGEYLFITQSTRIVKSIINLNNTAARKKHNRTRVTSVFTRNSCVCHVSQVYLELDTRGSRHSLRN